LTGQSLDISLLSPKAIQKCNVGCLTLKLINETPHYADGTGIYLIMKGTRDLAIIRKLAVVKLAN
jgi:hypothetical protein